MKHKRLIYIVASLLIVLAIIVVNIKITQTTQYQIYVVERTFYVKLPDNVKSLVFESKAADSYFSAAKIIISQGDLEGFIDSLNNSEYSKKENEYHTLMQNEVIWWNLDTSTIADFYLLDKLSNRPQQLDAFEVFVSDSIDGFVTIYLCKYDYP